MSIELIKSIISEETEKFSLEIIEETEIGGVQKVTMLATSERLKKRILDKLAETMTGIQNP